MKEWSEESTKKLLESDEEVVRMLTEWDRVRCKKCGKPISMLGGESVFLDDCFICKDCAKL